MFDAVVVGVPDERWGERVVAVVQPRPGAAPTLDDAARARACAPRGLQGAARRSSLVDAIVRSPSGKPDYRWARATADGDRPPDGDDRTALATRSRRANRLADETSPYLRQHADNPVDWYPWGDEAFARAREPTSRSSSRSGTRRATGATSWRTSRSRTPSTAEVMNELFVNVKVDREERPDVDAVYMQAVQALTGRGGWPMTVWLHARRPAVLRRHLLPERRPPRDAVVRARLRGGRRGVARTPRRGPRAGGRAHRGDRRAGHAARRRSVELSPPDCCATPTTTSPPQFDPSYGGFGAAPKFPQAMTLDFLLPRATSATRSDADARDDHDDARRDGRGRHVRPGRRRLRPLLHRRLLARAALREDALRQRAARRARTCTATCVTGEPRYRRDRRRDDRVRAARPPPSGRRLLLRRGRRLRGRRGQVLPLVARRDPRGVRRRRRRGRSATTASPRAGTSSIRTRGTRGNILHVVDRDRGAVRRRCSAARERLLDAPVAPRPPGLDDKVLLAWNALFLARADRGRGRARPRRLDGRGPRRTAASS